MDLPSGAADKLSLTLPPHQLATLTDIQMVALSIASDQRLRWHVRATPDSGPALSTCNKYCPKPRPSNPLRAAGQVGMTAGDLGGMSDGDPGVEASPQAVAGETRGTEDLQLLVREYDVIERLGGCLIEHLEAS
jgi:hypothetical protein